MVNALVQETQNFYHQWRSKRKKTMALYALAGLICGSGAVIGFGKKENNSFTDKTFPYAFALGSVLFLRKAKRFYSDLENKGSGKKVSPALLKILKYPKSDFGESKTAYSPFREEDLKLFLERVDIGFLELNAQKAFLQFILDETKKHPATAHLLRQPVRPLNLLFSDKGENLCFKFFAAKRDTILMDANRFDVFFHEYAHALQSENVGIARASSNLTDAMVLYDEAHAWANTFVLTDNPDIQSFIQKTVSVFQKRLQREYPYKTAVENKGLAEEKTIGLVMRSLLLAREERMSAFNEVREDCSYTSDEIDLWNFSCERWDYIMSQDIKGDFKMCRREHLLNETTDKEKEWFHLANRWFCEQTHQPTDLFLLSENKHQNLYEHTYMNALFNVYVPPVRFSCLENKKSYPRAYLNALVQTKFRV